MRRAILGGLTLLAGACNAILGIDEPVDPPAATGAVGGSDATVGGGGTSAGGMSAGGMGGGLAGAVSSGGGAGGISGSAGAAGSSGGDAATTDGTDPCGGCTPPTICEGTKCCNPGMPVSASDVTPSGTCGVVCNAGNAATQDDKGAGLDCSGSGSTTIDGQNVTGCVQVDFGTIYNPTDVVVRARLVSKACTVGCGLSSAGTDGCVLGGTVRVFRATSPPAYTHAGSITVGTTWSDQAVALGSPTRYVMACRSAYGSYVRDIEVDVIRSTQCP